MKYSAAILLALFGLTAASFLNHQEDVLGNTEDQLRRINNRDRIDDIDDINTHHGKGMLLEKQKIVLQLLSNLKHDTAIHEHLKRMGNDFNPFRNINRFHNNELVVKFLKNIENNNFLPKDEVFTPTNQQHQNQAAQLFTFMHSAQDWETLKHAAAWARNNLNNEQFAYTFAAVVLNHPTTQGVVIPALYEIIPHAFVPATTLNKIYKAKLEGLKKLTIKATYTNQNRNNNNYNKINLDNLDNLDNMDNINKRVMDNNNNEKNMWGHNNPNSVFADNDGSIKNNAGVSENPESKVSYFTEDIGINDLHARFHILNPAFLGVNKNKNYYTSNLETVNKENTIDVNKQDVRRGEAFIFAHQQLFARYVLERLSNNLPIPHPINLDDKIRTGYNPNLQHINGQAVPARPPMTKFLQHKVEMTNNNNDILMPNNNQAEKPQIYEQRLQEVAESGVVLNQDGSKTKLNKRNAVGILANLISAPASSLNPDYYGDYFSTAKNAIGNIVDPNNQNKVAPGVVSNYATAARDPAYYQLLAKLNQIVNNLQNKQGPYTKDELIMTGVKVQDVDVSDLETRFETFNVNVNNAVPKMIKNMDNVDNMRDMDIDEDYNVKFQRLTNKPFDIKLKVLSDKTRSAIIRVFIGPKYDSNGQRFTLPQASRFFVQLDQFKVQLHNGENVIVRNSQESNVNVHNPLSMKQLWKRVELAQQGQETFDMNRGDHQILGLLKHAQLPKGKINGQQFVMYIIVNDIDNTNDNLNSSEDNMSDMNMDVNMNGRTNINDKVLKRVRDNRSIGFPLDRPVVDVNFNTANQYFKTVTVHHKVNNDN